MVEPPSEIARRYAAIRDAVEARRGPRTARRIDPARSAPPPAVHEPGKVIDRRYTLERPLGTGGYSRVWLATDAGGGSVALKILHPEILTSPQLLRRFTREAEILSRLDHPFIARAIAFGVTDAEVYLAMEHVQGVALSTEMGARTRARQHYALDSVLHRLAAIAEALAYAHGLEVIHRDVKPQNVMVDTPSGGDDSETRVKVLDFGIAHFETADTGESTTQGRRLGSVFYMAPEQIVGAPLTPATDVFALACIAFELLSLCRPWLRDEQGRLLPAFLRPVPPISANSTPVVLHRIAEAQQPNLADLRPELPAAAGRVIREAMDTRPEARPRTAPAFVARLRDALAEVRGEDRLEPTQVNDGDAVAAIAALLSGSTPDRPIAAPGLNAERED